MKKVGKKVIAFYLILVIILLSCLPNYFTPKVLADTPVTYEYYERGCKVKVGTEEFYVVNDSDESKAKVTLLATKFVEVTTLSQSDDASKIIFSEEPYWEETYNKEGNLNVDSEPESTHTALYYAWKYGEKLGADFGRLPESGEFGIMNEAEFSEQFKNVREKACWSSTVFEDGALRCLNRDMSFKYDEQCFLRPVIEIAKDKVSKIYYNVSYNNTGLSHITVSFDKTSNIKSIDTVKVTITPDEGYEFVKPISGNVVINSIGSTVKNYKLENDGTYVADLKDFYQNEILTILANVDTIDLERPSFFGIIDGKSYCEDQKVVIRDDKELVKVTINGEEQDLGSGEFELPGTQEGKNYVITAVDKSGNTSTITCKVFNECDFSDFDCFVKTNTDNPQICFRCTRDASHKEYSPAVWELSETITPATVNNPGLGWYEAVARGRKSENKHRRAIPQLERADYTKVNEAKELVPDDLEENYTDDSATKVMNAVSNVNPDLPVDEQETVDGYAKKIKEAIDGLVLKPADYSEVDNLLAKIRLLNLSNYEEDTVEELNKVKDSIERDKNIKEQEEVDEYFNNLKTAEKNLKLKPADYTKVNEALEKTKSVTRKLYTQESLDVLDTAISNVVEGKNITDQDKVDEFATNIENALKGLQIKPGKEVEALVDEIRKMDLTLFTDETVENLENAIASTNDKDFSNPTVVNECLDKIQTAKEELELKPADYSKVNEAKKKASEIDRDLYTPASLANLDKALDNVEEDKKITEQNTVDGYASYIETALNALSYSPADYSAVDTAKYNASVVNRNLYTDESLENLDKVLNEVEEGKGVNEQDVVNKYAQNINNAIKDLKYLPASYHTLNDLLIEVRKLNLNNYTDESVKTLNNVMIKIRMDKNITEQEEVDKYVEELESARQGLVLRSADYSKVNEAKNDANKVNRKLYTQESLNKLDEAVKSVVEGKNILEQATVDGYATAIVEALKELKYISDEVGNLAKIIDEVKNTNYDNYTPETVKVLTELVVKIEKAEDITDAEKAKQYIEEINTAKNGLLLKSADYTAVEKAKSKAAEIDRNSYTSDSLKRLDDAISSVVEGKKITEQGIVDNYARNIEKAIETLVRKETITNGGNQGGGNTGSDTISPTPQPQPTPIKTPVNVVNPGTGDNIFDKVVMLIISVVGLIVIRILKKMN